MARKVHGKYQRRKGIEAEREFCRLTGAERVPLSGQTGGTYSGDARWLGLTWQIKREKDSWRTLYSALENHDALAVRADRKPWLVVMPLSTFQVLLERKGGDEDARTAP
ncbi:MAG TPA: hypothetical protein VIK75_04340 [Calditerricola sp.]